MDNERARKLTIFGGTILCLDVPEGTQIGIDNKLWTSGPHFKGIKMIPPGIHMFYTMSKNTFDETSPVNSYFINIQSPSKISLGDDDDEEIISKHGLGQVVIKKWNVLEEEFYTEKELSEDEISAYTSGVHRFDFDKNLAPYPVDDPSNPQWKRLVSHITTRLLKRIIPASGVINGEACSYSAGDENSSGINRKERKTLEDLDKNLKEFNQSRNIIPNKTFSATPTPTNTQSNDQMKSEDWGIPNFSKIPKTPPKTLNLIDPNSISKWNLDKSICLDYLLKKYCGPSGEYDMEMIGEIEFSYTLFVFGLTWSGFQQWKSLVSLFLQCDELVLKKPQLFIEFFDMLYYQLNDAPEDMFQSDLTSNIFIKPLLKSFIESNYPLESQLNINNDPIKEKLFKSVVNLKTLFESKFKVQFNLFSQGLPSFDDDNEEIEDDEDKPVFVSEEEINQIRQYSINQQINK